MCIYIVFSKDYIVSVKNQECDTNGACCGHIIMFENQLCGVGRPNTTEMDGAHTIDNAIICW